MHAYSYAARQAARRGRPRIRAWRIRRAWPRHATHGTYVVVVVPPVEARRAAFAAFVQRALRQAEARGLSVPKVAELAGIGSNTIYRWRDGAWVKGPLPDQVVAFCDALDIPPAVAFAVLWPGKNDPAPAVEPPPMDPDVAELLRRLADPNVPANERYHLLETVRSLVARRSSTRPPRKRRAS